jgi:hypothetical protein
VNRGTVYRWWPTPVDLLNDAVAFHWDQMVVPDTGSWEGDVRAVITALAGQAEDPVERAIMVAMTTGRYPEFNQFILDVWRRSVPQWVEMVRRAIDRGEVRPEADPHTVLNCMMSPLIATSLIGEGRISPRELELLIEFVCRATAAVPPP